MCVNRLLNGKEAVCFIEKMRGYPTSRWLAKTTLGLNMPRESPHDETITVAQVQSPVQALCLFSGDVGILALNENNYQ